MGERCTIGSPERKINDSFFFRVTGREWFKELLIRDFVARGC